MKFDFTPWREFRARRDFLATKRFLDLIGRETAKTLRNEILSPAKSGRMYGSHRASAPGEYPANETGRLVRSIKTRAAPNQVSIGTTIHYGRWLADGTSRMGKRKMSQQALEETLPRIWGRLGRFADWAR